MIFILFFVQSDDNRACLLRTACPLATAFSGLDTGSLEKFRSPIQQNTPAAQSRKRGKIAIRAFPYDVFRLLRDVEIAAARRTVSSFLAAKFDQTVYLEERFYSDARLPGFERDRL